MLPPILFYVLQLESRKPGLKCGAPNPWFFPFFITVDSGYFFFFLPSPVYPEIEGKASRGWFPNMKGNQKE